MAGAAHSLRLRARGPTRNGSSAGHSHPRRLCGQRITGRLVAANDAVSGPKPEAMRGRPFEGALRIYLRPRPRLPVALFDAGRCPVAEITFRACTGSVG